MALYMIKKPLSMNPTSIYMRKWRRKNAASVNARRREKYHANPEKYRARSKEASKKLLSTEEGRARYQTYYQRYRDRIFQELVDFFGGKCVHCGFEDGRALQLDHINGDGAKDRNRPGGFCLSARYKAVMQNPEWARKTLQLLCANCNCIKRAENREYAFGKRKQYAA
jgi:5-methylcytosine-specific restriction endonuclease McrA